MADETEPPNKEQSPTRAAIDAYLANQPLPAGGIDAPGVPDGTVDEAGVRYSFQYGRLIKAEPL